MQHILCLALDRWKFDAGEQVIEQRTDTFYINLEVYRRRRQSQGHRGVASRLRVLHDDNTTGILNIHGTRGTIRA